MEMIQERQQTEMPESDDREQVDIYVDTVFEILKKSICDPVIAIYKTKLNASLDLQEIRKILEAANPDLDTDHLTQKTAVEMLDLDAWLSLILQRWELFEPVLKNMGKGALEKIQEVHNDRLTGAKIAARDARNVTIMAHEMLVEFYCDSHAQQDVALIRNELLAIVQSDDTVTEKSAAGVAASENGHAKKIDGHWKGTQETAAVPLSSNGNGKSATTFSTNGHALHDKVEPLPSVDDAPKAKSALRIDKSRTHRVAPPTSQSVLQLEIVKRQGDTKSQKIDITKPSMLIGRSLMADIEISDVRISRMHLLIAGTLESGIKVTDLHSSNGTFIDGLPITPNTPTAWDIGQPITIGETLLILRQIE